MHMHVHVAYVHSAIVFVLAVPVFKFEDGASDRVTFVVKMPFATNKTGNHPVLQPRQFAFDIEVCTGAPVVMSLEFE